MSGKFYFAWLEDPEYGASVFSYDSQSESSNLRKEEQSALNVHMQYTVAVGQDTMYAFKDEQDPPEFSKY